MLYEYRVISLVPENDTAGGFQGGNISDIWPHVTNTSDTRRWVEGREFSWMKKNDHNTGEILSERQRWGKKLSTLKFSIKTTNVLEKTSPVFFLSLFLFIFFLLFQRVRMSRQRQNINWKWCLIYSIFFSESIGWCDDFNSLKFDCLFVQIEKKMFLSDWLTY